MRLNLPRCNRPVAPGRKYTKKSTKKVPTSQKQKRAIAFKTRIKPNLVRVIREHGYVTCHEPKSGGSKYIHVNRNGYSDFHMSVSDATITVHRLSYLVNRANRVSDAKRIYHLCNNLGCCKPSHLVAETPGQYATRDGCLGYLLNKSTGVIIKCCPHAPACIKVTDIDTLERVDPKDIDLGMVADHDSDIEEEVPEDQMVRQVPEEETSEEEESEEEPEEESESSEEEAPPVTRSRSRLNKKQ